MKRPVAALLLLAACAACGKKGDPLPPLSRTPQPVTDLRLAQRGRELVYSFTTPRVTVAATRLPVLEIELLRASGEGDFQRLAKRDRRKALPGKTLEETVPLPAPGTLVRVSARAIAGGSPSQVTKIVAMTVMAPPPTPTDLTAVLQPNGVALSWKGVVPPLPPSPPPPSPSPTPTPAASAAGANPAPSPSPSATPTPPPPPARGFSVYRRDADDVYTAPLNGVPTPGNTWADTTVEIGQSFCYVVRMALSTDPLVESEPSNEVCVTMKDIAAPAAPTGVTALVQTDHVEVSWSPSSETDLKAYKVYRTAGGDKPTLLGQVAAGETVFRDRTPGKGGAHFYTVTAVDEAGNESPPSSPAEGHLP